MLQGGQTPLLAASANGCTGVVTALLGAGADKDARDKDEVTALHAASAAGHLQVVRALVAAGADRTAKKKVRTAARSGGCGARCSS